MSAQRGEAGLNEPPRSTRAAADDHPLIVLVGRPNSGKSSLYNALTGGDAHVGNFPGITVDILEAEVALGSGVKVTIADLPGLYSIDAPIDPDTDEGVARRFLDDAEASTRPLVLVQVVDTTRLGLALRLTRELVKRKARLLVVATQADVLEAEARILDANALAREIGAPVLLVSARDPKTRGRVFAALEEQLARPTPSRAAKSDWEPDAVSRRHLADASSVSKPASLRRRLTARADAVLLHPLIGPVIFLGLMAALFGAVFLVADPATALIDSVVGAARGKLSASLGSGLLASFIGDGLLGGAGTVLAFMPQILILTVAMELLEASGYLARGSFLVDRVLRFLGLSGHAFLPLLMGHACAVPAVSATRILRDPHERLTTILVLPLMTCSARIPTYALVLGTFFAASGAFTKALIFVGLYFAGIGSGLVASLLLRRTATRGRSLPLVLEMPAYRLPQPRIIARKTWQAAGRFLRDVGTTIIAVAAVLWVLLTVPFPGSAGPTPGEPTSEATVRMERSVAATVGRALEPVTKPLGFDWKINVGLVSSFGARELMVGTLGVIFGIEDASDDPGPLSERIREAKKPDGSPKYTKRTGLALLAFFLFACQCMSTLAAVRRETKTWRWPAFIVAYTYGIAYVAALLVYQLSGLLGVA